MAEVSEGGAVEEIGGKGGERGKSESFPGRCGLTGIQIVMRIVHVFFLFLCTYLYKNFIRNFLLVVKIVTKKDLFHCTRKDNLTKKRIPKCKKRVPECEETLVFLAVDFLSGGWTERKLLLHARKCSHHPELSDPRPRLYQPGWTRP